MPALPPGHWPAETPFSILPNIPLVWLALAVPLAWRRRSAEARSILCGFLVVAALLGGTCALTICFWCGATVRYEVEFLPALVLLAVIGILGCEHALAPTSESGPACRPVWRRAARWGWGLLLGFSVAFNLLASIEHYAEAHYNLGNVLLHQGKEAEAIAHYEQALRLNPDYAEAYNNLGIVLMDQGRVPEAMAHFEQAVRIKPDHALAHNNLGNALLQSGRIQEAIQQYEQVLRIRPDLAEAHFNMGNALTRVGRLQDAVEHYEQTVRIKPDNAEAHNRLGNALMQTGRMQEAIAHFEQALRLKPDSAEVHDNLGVALEQTGNVPEAIKHYEQALQIKPDFTQAQNALARLHAGQ
jgi:tetratricopeptide (TPR) repeat protein